MDREKSSKLFSLVSVFLVLLFVVGVYAFADRASMAWFGSNLQVRGEGMQVKIRAKEPIQTNVTLYQIESKVDGTLYFDATTAQQNPTVISMPKYDILDDVSRYLLLRLDIEVEPRPFVLTADTNTTYFLDGDHPLLGTVNGRGETYDNCITSILSIAQVVNVDQTTDPTKCAVTLPETLQSFATEVDGEMTINNSLEIANGTFNSIFVLIAYNEDNVTRIYSENIGNDAFTEDHVVLNGITYFMDFVFNLTVGAV